MKFTQNKKKLAMVAIMGLPLLGSISSCKKDFLKRNPELQLPQENAFANQTRIQALINGLYSSAKGGPMFGGRYQIFNDIQAEEFINRTTNGVTGYNVYQGTNNSADTYTSNLWATGYMTINRANLFLKGISENSGVVSADVEQNFIGEAKFLRALSYFALVQMFAKPYVSDNGASRGLPLRLKAETSIDNNVMKSSTVAAIYTQILKDLDEAETALPNTYTSALNRTTRAHKNTAIALKTRVYLTMGNYTKALEEGNKLVPQAAPFVNSTRVAHALQPTLASVFVSPYTTSESIFSFPFADTNAPGTQNPIGYYFTPNGTLDYYLNRTGTGIYADPSWPATDARKTALTASTTISGTAYAYVSKFSAPSPFLDYTPILRYAELLLNVAEAETLASGGNLTRARAILDAVRQRSDPNYSFGNLATSTDLLNAILKERRIELLGEGFRFTDIARRNLPIPSFGAGANIPVNDPRYNFPIPEGELSSNPDANKL